MFVYYTKVQTSGYLEAAKKGPPPLPLETCCLFVGVQRYTGDLQSPFVKDRLSPLISDVCSQLEIQNTGYLEAVCMEPPFHGRPVACLQLEAQNSGYLEAVCVRPPPSPMRDLLLVYN